MPIYGPFKKTKRLFHSSFFVLFLACMGSGLSLIACDTPATEKITETAAEAKTETTTETTPDASPQEKAIETSLPDEPTSPETTLEPAKETTPQEMTPDPTSEPTPEATPEPTPETPADVELIKGACQSSSPRCPPGYGCRDDVDPAVCHLSCDPETPACPAGRLCLVLSTGAGICVEGTVAQKGQACDLQKICDKGLVCVLSSPPNGTCYQRCTLQNQQCPSGEVCFLAHSKNGACITGTAGQKAIGAQCSNTLECAPGSICFLPFQQTDKICAALCDTDSPCSMGQICVPVDGAPTDSGVCKQ